MICRHRVKQLYVMTTAAAPACRVVVKARHSTNNGVDQHVALCVIKFQHSTHLGNACLQQILAAALLRLAANHPTTPFPKHLLAFAPQRLLVPDCADRLVNALADREVGDLPHGASGGLRTAHFYCRCLCKPLKVEMSLQKHLHLNPVAIVAIGKYVEEVAVLDVAIPIPHEISEHAQLLREEPPVAYVVLESTHRTIYLRKPHVH